MHISRGDRLEISHFCNFRTSVTLISDQVTRHTVMYHSSTSIYKRNVIKIRKTFLWTDRLCIYVRMDTESSFKASWHCWVLTFPISTAIDSIISTLCQCDSTCNVDSIVQIQLHYRWNSNMSINICWDDTIQVILKTIFPANLMTGANTH